MPYRFIHRKTYSHYFLVWNNSSENKLIFRTAHDYKRFTHKIAEYSVSCKVAVIAFLLVGSGYYIIVEEKKLGNIARFMQKLNVSHAMYFNNRYSHVGHIYQGPYKERLLQNEDEVVQSINDLKNTKLPSNRQMVNYKWTSAYKDSHALYPWLSKSFLEKYFVKTT